MVTEIETLQGGDGKRDEAHKRDRYHFEKANFDALREYFGNINQSDMMTADNVHGKYDKFIKVYNEGLGRYVPKLSESLIKKKEWFNTRYERACQKETRHGIK